MKPDSLRTYLTDHLAGARYALDLVERCRRTYTDPPLAAFFDDIGAEVEQDRAVLHAMLRRVGGSESRVKSAGARLLERVSRLKQREPSAGGEMGLLERLEILSLGVAGKRSLWEALDACSGGTGHFGGVELAVLKRSADEQHRKLEARRREAARGAFLPGMRQRDGTARGRDAGPLEGVLLDVDGTLVATNDAHTRAWVDAFADVGLDLPFLQIRPLIGLSGDRLVAELTGIGGDKDESRFIRDRQSMHFLERYLDDCEPFPGVRELLECMAEDGLELTVVTSSSEDKMERVLELAGVTDLVDRTASAGDVEASKPDPDMIRWALDISGWAPHEALLLGDTPYDVRAGVGAGVGVVGVRCGGSGDAELAGAMAVYDDPADLLSAYPSSPFRRHPAARPG